MIAAQHGRCEIIEILLKNGADVNAVNKVIIGPKVVDIRGRLGTRAQAFPTQ